MTLEELKQYLTTNNISFNELNNGLEVVGDRDVGIQTATLPANITFSNNGSVTLRDLVVLPNNILFNNTGIVDLPALKSEKQIYQGEEITLKLIGDTTCIIYSEKQKYNLILIKGALFSGSRYSNIEYFIIIDGETIHAERELDHITKGKYARGIFGDFNVFNFIKEEDF